MSDEKEKEPVGKYGFTNDRAKPRQDPVPLGRYLVEIVRFGVQRIKHSKTRPKGEHFFKIVYRVFMAWPDSKEVRVMAGEEYEQTIFVNRENEGLSNRDLINYCAATFAAKNNMTTMIDTNRVAMAIAHKASDTLVCVEEYIDKGETPGKGVYLQLKREQTITREQKIFPVHVWSPMAQATRDMLARQRSALQQISQTQGATAVGAAGAENI